MRWRRLEQRFRCASMSCPVSGFRDVACDRRTSCDRLKLVGSLLMLTTLSTPILGQSSSAPAPVFPGVWRITFGAPEQITPVSVRHFPPAGDGLAALPRV